MDKNNCTELYLDYQLTDLDENEKAFKDKLDK